MVRTAAAKSVAGGKSAYSYSYGMGFSCTDTIFFTTLIRELRRAETL